MSILLSQVVHQPSKKGTLRERLYLKACEFYDRYRGNEVRCDANIWSTFTTLFELVRFFDEFHDKNYQQALETLRRTRLVPLRMEDLETCVNNFKRYYSWKKNYSSEAYSLQNSIFSRLGGEVSKVFPDLLLTTMDILYTQYKALKGKDTYTFNTDAARDQVCLLSEEENLFF